MKDAPEALEQAGRTAVVPPRSAFLRTHLLPLLGLLFAHVAVFAPFIFRDPSGAPYQVIRFDFASQYYPWLVYASDVLRSGQFPLWCPTVAAGTPFFLNPQVPLYSPVTWLVTALHGYTQYVAQLQSITWILIGGIGAYGLSYALWRSRSAALVTALCFDLSPAVFGNLEHSSFIYAFSLIPWLFWAVRTVVVRPGRAPVAMLAGALYLMIVTGYPAIVLMAILWLLVWATCLLFSEVRNTAARWAALGRGMLAGAFAVGLSTVYWGPLAYYVREFTRSNVMGFEQALTGGNLRFVDLWNLVFPFLVVHPLPASVADVSMRGLYVGIVALPLIGLAIWRDRSARVTFLAVMACMAFLMASGSEFFGRVALHMGIPALNFSRFPAGDSRTLMALALALLAGNGLRLGIERDRRATHGLLAGYGTLGVIGLGAFAVMPALYPPDVWRHEILNALTPGLLWCGLAGLAVSRLGTAVGARVLIGLLALDLGVAVTQNFSVAGERPANYAGLRAMHRPGFSTAAAALPRKDGTTGDLRETGTCEPANVGYLSKEFYLGEYNPLRLQRYESLLNQGLADWLRQGPRVVGWSSPKDPASSEEFLAHATKVSFEVRDYGPNHVTYRVKLDQPSLLVFNEVYFPGWSGQIGRTRTPMREVLGGLRAASLPSGSHEFTTVFAAPILPWAATMSLMTLGGVLLYLATARRSGASNRIA